MMTQEPVSSSGSTDLGSDGALAQAGPAVIDSVQGLVAAREAKGLSSGDIASQLKLATRQIVALERADWGALPGMAFVRGALRGYGRVLGVEVDGLLATLTDGARTPELRPSTSLEAPMPSGSMLGFGSGGGGSKTAWLILGAILLAALALFFGRDTDFSTIPSLLPGYSKPPATPESGAGAAPTGTGVEPIPTLPQSKAPAAASAPPAVGLLPAQSAQLATLSPPPSQPPPSQEPQSPQSQPSQPSPPAAAAIRLQFDRESWVEIRQADGRTLLFGQQKAGSVAQLPLATETSILIGNADHVRLEHNGRPIDLKFFAPQGVARLKLNP